MAIKELTDEQVRTMSLEEKDRWWLRSVFQGAMPQLTIRSALTGMLLGGVLSLTNLYIGAKTGWTLGVGITSVILAFAMFKLLSRIGLGSEFTILENNAMQSIATAAGYMTSPMISSLAAYMMVTGQVLPMYQTMSWIAVLAILGVLFAFPFKRRFINDEQQPFPEGRAAGFVMDSLHHGDAATGMLKAELLLVMGGIAAAVKFFQSATIMGWLLLRALPEYLDEWFDSPTIGGQTLQSLTLRPELDLPMVGAGGLMGIRTGFSILLGAFVNYAILAPIMINAGDIVPNSKGTIGFREITFWSLWGGVAMMTIASLVAFFAKPQILLSAFTSMLPKKAAPTPPVEPELEEGGAGVGLAAEERLAEAGITSTPGAVAEEHRPAVSERDLSDVNATMNRIELPLLVSVIGIPLLSVVVVAMAYSYFGVAPWLSVTAILMVFFFCLIAINSTGLTSITPIGAMGKLTQLAFGALAPGDKTVNLMTAGITGEVASHSANLLSDIKPGYMLGAKPRQQAVGHVLGVIAGALLSVPVFYIVFLQLSPAEAFSPNLAATYKMDAEQYPMPAATIWKAVADVLAQGLEHIKESARWAAGVCMLLGLAMEVMRIVTKNRFPLSPVAIGLGFVIPFSNCLSMFIGSLLFWVFEQLYADKESSMNRVVVQNQEPICAGLIAGGSLMGIVVAIADVVLGAGH